MQVCAIPVRYRVCYLPRAQCRLLVHQPQEDSILWELGRPERPVSVVRYSSYHGLTLRGRYQCLEAIVKGAFPNESLDSVQDLERLGQRMGYKMPNLADRSRVPVKVEDLVRVPDSQVPSQFDQAQIQADSNSTIAEGSLRGGDKSRPRTRSNSQEPQASLVRDTSGNEHYIGPSGTWNFLNQLRKLVDTNNAAIESTSLEGAKFALDDPQPPGADEQREEPGENQPVETNALTAQDGVSPVSITSAITCDFPHLPSADMNEVLKQFPPDETLELLIDSYFKNVHDDFPLFHRATFEDEYELYIVQVRRRPQLARPRQRPLPDWGWIGCLHMMIVFGSITNRSIENIDHENLCRKSVTIARALLPQFISKCSLANVRVLLLLAIFLHNNNERNAAWNLVGTATRISFALGLHRSDMSSSFRPLEREVRKWVFCTLYSFEQFLASSLGRPSGVQDIDVEIVPPREGFVDGGSGTDAKLVSWSLKLQGILAKTRLIHVVKRSSGHPSHIASAPTVQEILISLDKWKQEISQGPGFDLPWVKSQQGAGATPSANETNAMDLEELRSSLSWKTHAQVRAVLLLHIQFHYIAIVATRPILLRDIAMLRKPATEESSRNGSMSSYSEFCVKHACQLGYLVVLLDSFDVMNGLSGLDIFYAYCAAMILIVRLILKPGLTPTETMDQDASQAKEAELQVCIRGLVSNIQDVINRADKSSSMARFARVIDAFAECINRPSNQISNLTNHDTYSTNQQPQVSVSGNRAQIVPNFGNHLGHPDEQPSGHSQMGTPVQFMGSNMEGLLDFWPLSTFGGAGMDGGPLTQYLGSEDLPMPEWSDMELFLAGYGGPS